MRITTDPDLCVGAGQCVLAAPEIFDQDEDAVVTLINGSSGDNSLDRNSLERARDAVDRCPSGAIALAEN